MSGITDAWIWTSLKRHTDGDEGGNQTQSENTAAGECEWSLHSWEEGVCVFVQGLKNKK